MWPDFAECPGSSVAPELWPLQGAGGSTCGQTRPCVSLGQGRPTLPTTGTTPTAREWVSPGWAGLKDCDPGRGAPLPPVVSLRSVAPGLPTPRLGRSSHWAHGRSFPGPILLPRLPYSTDLRNKPWAGATRAWCFPRGSWLSRIVFTWAGAKAPSPTATSTAVILRTCDPGPRLHRGLPTLSPTPQGGPQNRAHLSIQEGLALKLQAPEPQLPGKTYLEVSVGQRLPSPAYHVASDRRLTGWAGSPTPCPQEGPLERLKTRQAMLGQGGSRTLEAGQVAWLCWRGLPWALT